ncbi:hypothetical protein KCP91_08140 [Microvirga sp. SRT01]|uniref:Uncharacterized protein n=1 Tax=Sphingomonas longa TaxID=2778730 RepID=A0ABS2D600_9SPHN|nr:MULTISPECIES: hypothetical protein [Alphaproteobacteria]MBM6576340.1 hypothetical protein [Sphingomonas sp. BT552]MBR7709386.1 hypothetical protein [Microvirga sp. SRT01]
MLITMPASPVAANIDWDIEQPGQANRSEFTGRRRVTQFAQAPRWYASVTLPPIIGEARVLDWRAFVVDCDGVANSFRLIASERNQCFDDGVTVKGGGHTGFVVPTQGWSSRGIVLRRGQMVTINDQLLMLTAPVVVGNDGEAYLYVKPYLRFPTVNGMQVHVRRPFAVMAMSDPRNGWKVGIGQNYAVTFKCEEAF